jgi:hypothetical protein
MKLPSGIKTNLCDNIVGIIRWLNHKPTVYAGCYDADYLRIWAENIQRENIENEENLKVIRIYAQYSEHSDSFALIAVPEKKTEGEAGIAISGFRETKVS